MMYRFLGAIVCVMVLACCSPVQAGTTVNKHRRIRIAQRSERGGKGEGSWQLLKQPMSLPDLPPYSGKAKFLGGLMYPKQQGGPAITMHYITKAEAGDVLGWYEDTLKAYHWIIDSSAPDRRQSIRARRGNNGVVVRVKSAPKGKYKADLVIAYKLSTR